MAPLLALLPALVPAVAPVLGRLIAGSDGEKAGRDVAAVVEAVAGGTDEASVRQAMADPEKAGAVLVQLNTIAAQREAAADQARLEMFRAATADAASARAASSASPLIARAQVTLAAVITLMFGLTLVLAATRGVPPGIDLLLGALIAAFAGVTAFFFGNSTSGHTANNTLAALAGRPASAPAAIATTGTVVVPGQPSPPGTTADDVMAAFNRRAP